MMCETFKDRHNNWTKPIATTTRNPVINSTHPYNQNCSVWSIDYRNNHTHCPALMRPLCHVNNPRQYKFKCPFGIKDGIDGATQEYCECMNVTKQRMNVSHPIYCTCTRNLLSSQAVKNAGQYCFEYYLFTKKCVVHYPYEVTRKNQTSNETYTVTRYYFNCSFVNCHDSEYTELYQITGFNTTCSNGYSLAQPSTTAKPTTTTTTSTTTSTTVTTTSATTTVAPTTTLGTTPTTTTKITTPTITGKITTPTITGKITTPTITGKITTPTITGKITTPTMTGKITTPTITSKITTPTTISPTSTTTTPATTATTTTSSTTAQRASTSNNIPATTNPTLTILEKTSISNIIHSGNTVTYKVGKSIFTKNKLSDSPLSIPNIEYSKQINESSIFGILILAAVIQLFLIFGVGYGMKKLQKRN